MLDPLNDGMAYGRMLQQDGSLFGASVSGFIIALVAGILVLGAVRLMHLRKLLCPSACCAQWR